MKIAVSEFASLSSDGRRRAGVKTNKVVQSVLC